jgi:predicted transcriptional regulator
MDNRTTIQVSDNVRKELKILASRRDVSYEILLKDMIDVFKELDRNKTVVSIPTPLAEKLKGKDGFSSVGDYCSFVLRLALSEQAEKEELTKTDEQKIKRKLKALGYLG